MYRKHSNWNWQLFYKRSLTFIFVNLVIINTGYYFHQSFWKLGEYSFMSDLFQRVQNTLPAWLPLPFPKPFVDGLDMTKYYDQIGGGTSISSFGNVTIFGESRTAKGVWYYYFVSILFKFPIAYFILLAWSVWILLGRGNRNKFFQNELFLTIPIFYFLIIMSFFYKTQCGVRHIIFLLPLLMICFGSILTRLRTKSQKYLLGAVSFYLVFSVLSYWKNYYPYTNEFVIDKKNAYRYVGSQNLDFLQGGLFLKKFLAANNNVALAPKAPQPGVYVISIHDYMDNWNRHNYEWIKCYQPIDHIAHSYLIIDARKPCSNIQ
jgi:hypothetical protein